MLFGINLMTRSILEGDYVTNNFQIQAPFNCGICRAKQNVNKTCSNILKYSNSPLLIVSCGQVETKVNRTFSALGGAASRFEFSAQFIAASDNEQHPNPVLSRDLSVAM